MGPAHRREPPSPRRLQSRSAARRVCGQLDGYLPAASTGASDLGFAVPLRLRTAEGELRLITTLTSFATAVDITLAEPYLEAFLPADAASTQILFDRAHRHATEAESPLPPELLVGQNVECWASEPFRRRALCHRL
jgi:hypothetical protein